MKICIPALLGIVLLAGCGDSRDSVNVVAPEPPPQEPEPVDPAPPTMRSFADFARVVYADDADGSPREINDISFNKDAGEDDFSDLLQ